MPRLFVAIDLPDELRQVLQTWPPTGVRGIRCTPSEQMHLTLHFLGECARQPIVEALSRVVAESFPLQLKGVGKFGAANCGVILWAGVEPQSALTKLHAALADTLSKTGYQPESRPYHPHITLARCQPHALRQAVDDFLRAHDAESLPPFVATEFALYSSELTPRGPVHAREQAFALRAAQQR